MHRVNAHPGCSEGATLSGTLTLMIFTDRNVRTPVVMPSSCSQCTLPTGINKIVPLSSLQAAGRPNVTQWSEIVHKPEWSSHPRHLSRFFGRACPDLSGGLGRYCFFFLRYKRWTTYPSLGNKGECAPTSPLSEGATSSGTLTKNARILIRMYRCHPCKRQAGRM